MHILITGGTGFIGTALIQRFLEDPEMQITVLSRTSHESGPRLRFISSLDNLSLEEKIDGVINLAGENIGDKLWTDARKKVLLSSRVKITQGLVDLCGRLNSKPKFFISASAVGYYGPQGDTELTEKSEPVSCFSHMLCDSWEAHALMAQKKDDIPTYILRFGVVLASDGGVFRKFEPCFRFSCVPYYFERIYFPWVSRDDVIGVIQGCMNGELGSPGIMNVVAPDTTDYTHFFRACKKHLGLKFWLPVPTQLLKPMLGEMGKEIVFGSFRVTPESLSMRGYTFVHPTLKSFLSNLRM